MGSGCASSGAHPAAAILLSLDNCCVYRKVWRGRGHDAALILLHRCPTKSCNHMHVFNSSDDLSPFHLGSTAVAQGKENATSPHVPTKTRKQLSRMLTSPKAAGGLSTSRLFSPPNKEKILKQMTADKLTATQRQVLEMVCRFSAADRGEAKNLLVRTNSVNKEHISSFTDQYEISQYNG